MTWEEIKRIGDECAVHIAAAGEPFESGKRLEPLLWEDLRLEMQRRYRRATGEEFAVVVIQNGEP